MSEERTMSLTAPAGVDMRAVVGAQDENLRVVEQAFDARVTVRGNRVEISGDEADVGSLCTLFDSVFKRVSRGEAPGVAEVRRMVDAVRTGAYTPAQIHDDVVLAGRGRAIRPKTTGQKRYVDAIRGGDITFGIGPAGTGKTYLAMACAIAALRRKDVGRVVLTRPVVEAGENLGYLPGTLSEKVDPYIRPLYDALFDMVDADEADGMLHSGVIEVAPLAFMRGRTLNDAFVVLDEAQNTTPEQMKMFLTRLGFGSKMVVNGDVTQVDLVHGASGLVDAQRVLKDVDGVSFVRLSGKDVVRHSLVAAIVAAYDAREAARSGARPDDGPEGAGATASGTEERR